jgi:hypothetical protein
MTLRRAALVVVLGALLASETLEDPNPPWWDYVLLENHPTLLQRIEMTRYYVTGRQPSRRSGL